MNKTQKEIIEMLSKVMEKYPELRFYQVIGNCFAENDLYYKTDEQILKALRLNYAL